MKSLKSSQRSLILAGRSTRFTDFILGRLARLVLLDDALCQRVTAASQPHSQPSAGYAQVTPNYFHSARKWPAPEFPAQTGSRYSHCFSTVTSSP